jgi:ferritin
MPGIPVPPPVIAELQRQMNHELGAAHAYTALAVWSFDQNLKGFSRYFYKQASEEREHAQKFIDHLQSRGVMPELRDLPAPKAKFKTLLEVAKHARSMEQANTSGINKAYKVATTKGDYPSQVLLQWFVNEQVEEESWSDEMVQRAELAVTPGGIAALDRHIVRYLGDPGREGAEEND